MRTQVLLIVVVIPVLALVTTCYGASGPYVCMDEDSSCPAWAHRGDCQSNPRWMQIHCERSCNECATCADQHRNCEKWAIRGDCDINTFWMMRNCKKACLKC